MKGDTQVVVGIMFVMAFFWAGFVAGSGEYPQVPQNLIPTDYIQIIIGIITLLIARNSYKVAHQSHALSDYYGKLSARFKRRRTYEKEGPVYPETTGQMVIPAAKLGESDLRMLCISITFQQNTIPTFDERHFLFSIYDSQGYIQQTQILTMMRLWDNGEIKILSAEQNTITGMVVWTFRAKCDWRLIGDTTININNQSPWPVTVGIYAWLDDIHERDV